MSIYINIYLVREKDRREALAILSCKKVTKETMEDGDFPEFKFDFTKNRNKILLFLLNV